MRMIFLISTLLICGCASTPKTITLPDPPSISTSYAGGKTILNWKADAGESYTIFYSDSPHGTRPVWAPLPSATQLQGNGQQITIEDQVNKDSARRYLLMTGDRHP